MKRKKMSRKLALNKITITTLNSNDLANRKAGAQATNPTFADLCTEQCITDEAYCQSDASYCPTHTDGFALCTRVSDCHSYTIP